MDEGTHARPEILTATAGPGLADRLILALIAVRNRFDLTVGHCARTEFIETFQE